MVPLYEPSAVWMTTYSRLPTIDESSVFGDVCCSGAMSGYRAILPPSLRNTFDEHVLLVRSVTVDRVGTRTRDTLNRTTSSVLSTSSQAGNGSDHDSLLAFARSRHIGVNCILCAARGQRST